MKNILDSLMIKYESDKGCNKNNYCRYYHEIFKNNAESYSKVLEIGVQNGYSIKAWEDYFVNSEIHGIDILESCKQFESERIKIHIGDQSDPIFLNSIGTNFDVIVDDGSHKTSDVIASFKELWKHIKPGGYYIVEDLGVSVGSRYGNYRNLGEEYTAIDFLHELNKQFFKHGFVECTEPIAEEIESMFFGRWICFIKKSL